MRVTLAVVGRLKAGAERELFERYWDRFAASGRRLALSPVEVSESTESRAGDAETRKREEADRLLAAAGGAVCRVVLDETGKALTSAAFARFVGERRDGGVSHMAFLIGGPDGHGAAALDGAALKLSLGSMTLPHALARIVLAEQLYRAATILSGHPYHRA